MTEQSTHPIVDYLEIPRACNPTFSPDGKTIAYLTNRTGTYQLHTMHVDGTQNTALTQYADPVEWARYSPASQEILFAIASGGNERNQLHLISQTGQIRLLTSHTTATFRGGTWSQDGQKIAYASTERNGVDFDIYVLDKSTGVSQRVFDAGGYCYALTFSPNGKYLGIIRERHAIDKEVFLVDLETNHATRILPHAEKGDFHRMQWKSDNSGFFFITNEKTDFSRVCLFDIKTNTSQTILQPEWDVESISLTRDGKTLGVIFNEKGYSRFQLYSTRDWKITYECPLRGSIESPMWNPDGDKIAFTFNGAQDPDNIWLYDLPTHHLQRLTSSPSRIPFTTFVHEQLHAYQSFDNLEIPYFVHYPESTTPSPVIINIHGGPWGQSTAGYYGLTQYFVKQGYVVVAPNIRGSSGYGKKYSLLDDGRKRGDTIKDLEFLHHHLSQDPKIDSKRMILMGGSYGGYMVLCGLAFQPQLWAAGIDIVGISNLVNFLKNTSPYRRGVRETEYGTLAHDSEFMESISPGNYTKNIRAPLLVIHGANDPRVPLSEAETIVNKLKQQGNVVEFIVYPNEGHGLSKLQNRIDAYTRVTQFLETHVRN